MGEKVVDLGAAWRVGRSHRLRMLPDLTFPERRKTAAEARNMGKLESALGVLGCRDGRRGHGRWVKVEGGGSGEGGGRAAGTVWQHGGLPLRRALGTLVSISSPLGFWDCSMGRSLVGTA